MGIRIKPSDIDVPKDEPFKYDLLGRQEPAEVLTHLVGDLQESCVLAVDALWGAGKTTFLRMWTQHLRNQGFPVVEFNAWETDFSEEPFFTLSTELTEGLQPRKTETIKKLKEASKGVLRWVVPSAIRIAASSVPGASPKLSETAASYVEEMWSGHLKARKSVAEFRRVLQDIAATLSEANGNRPLMIVIDELDRCRPSYAIELLEVAKHLFSVDRIVFVLAVNRDQLTHSVRALYGSDFDAVGYLRRFIDVDFQLPEPDRDEFIREQLRVTGIVDFFDQTPEKPSYFYPLYFSKEVERKESGENLHTMLQKFFGASDLSLRTVGQAIHRLGLLFASLRSDQPDHALMTTVALILRTMAPNLYHRFNRGEATDLDVVNAIFGRPGLKALQHEEWGIVFESSIVLAALEDETRDLSPSEIIDSTLFSPEPIRTPLLDWYKSRQQTDREVIEKGSDLEIEDHISERKHAECVFNKVSEAIQNGKGQIGFHQAVRRLELLTTTLVDNDKQSDPSSVNS